MRAECIRAFVAQHEGQTYAFSEGDTLDLPHGVDWVKAGFVKELKQSPPQPEVNAAPKRKAGK